MRAGKICKQKRILGENDGKEPKHKEHAILL